MSTDRVTRIEVDKLTSKSTASEKPLPFVMSSRTIPRLSCLHEIREMAGASSVGRQQQLRQRKVLQISERAQP